MYCNHPRMTDTARLEWCPDCGYEYYYGDAHATNPEDRVSKLIHAGRDRTAGRDPQEVADEFWREEERKKTLDDEERERTLNAEYW